MVITPQPGRKSSKADLYIGSKLRSLRKKRGISQPKLANVINLSHQQIQQYELGTTRIASSTLYDLSKILHVDIRYFFEGIEEIQKNDLKIEGHIKTDRSHPLNILLIEKNTDDEFVTRKAIESCKIPCGIHAIHSGIEAMEFLRNKKGINTIPRPDIILLELDLSKKDGIQILRSIKSDHELLYIPVIILTHSIKAEQMLESYRLGASGFLNKSFDTKKFHSDISTAISYWSTVILPNM